MHMAAEAALDDRGPETRTVAYQVLETLTEQERTDLPKIIEAVVAMMVEVFEAGHNARKGGNQSEWREKEIKVILTKILKHVERPLGQLERPEHELLYVLDEKTQTPDLGNAMLRMGMLVVLLQEREEREALKSLKENNPEN